MDVVEKFQVFDGKILMVWMLMCAREPPIPDLSPNDRVEK
jgi:hypothetical protein